jgi:hypothetical protein
MDADNELKLTSQQAYEAMYLFLEDYYERFKAKQPDELAILLGSMQLLSDGMPADPAFRQDWQRCVLRVLEGR